MKKIVKNYFKIMFFSVFSVSAYATSIPNITNMVKLDTDEIIALETKGEIVFVSKNGRYVFEGRLTDVWQKKPLDSMEEIRYSSEHINLKRMGIPLGKMNSIVVGNGSNELIAFVDPLCGFCKEFINSAKMPPDTQLRLIVIPALGDESNDMAKKIYCTTEKDKALETMLSGTISSLPDNPQCNKEYYDLTLKIAQTIGIDKVPFLIAPDGRYRYGAPKDIWSWATP